MKIQLLGPTCTGKSSLAEHLSKRLKFNVYYEPTDCSEFFPKFVENKSKYAFANQNEFLDILYRYESSMDDHESTIQDSGLVAAHHVYTNYFYEKEYLSTEQFTTLKHKFDDMFEQISPPQYVVFLVAPTDILEQRTIKRDGHILHDLDEIIVWWEKLYEMLVPKNDIKILKIATHNSSIADLGTRIITWLNVDKII